MVGALEALYTYTFIDLFPLKWCYSVRSLKRSFNCEASAYPK
ncbi:hypothetical protein VCRA2120E57_30176 [Vibrio crassostreae]|nr:hypothetical protein VCRA2120E57_30176 [Vibrio crassostreae]